MKAIRRRNGDRIEQYFTAHPSSPDSRRSIEVVLRGRRCRVEVSAGVFSAGRIDTGTGVLLKRVPDPPRHGVFLDLGCGWGPLALAMALASPHATVYAVDVNERALDLTARNAAANGCGNVMAVTPDQLALHIDAGTRFDAIWSNPPIRVGKRALHELLTTYLPLVVHGGAAWLVVQHNLGADSLIPWLAQALGADWRVAKTASSKGYRVIRALHASEHTGRQRPTGSVMPIRGTAV